MCCDRLIQEATAYRLEVLAEQSRDSEQTLDSEQEREDAIRVTLLADLQEEQDAEMTSLIDDSSDMVR